MTHATVVGGGHEAVILKLTPLEASVLYTVLSNYVFGGIKGPRGHLDDVWRALNKAGVPKASMKITGSVTVNSNCPCDDCTLESRRS